MIAPAKLVPHLIEIAENAGRVILDHYAASGAGSGEVTLKSDSSPVTAADAAAEKVILDALRSLTPSIPIVAEEAVAGGDIPEVGDGMFWLVDPLDGTREFISRNGEFTVNVALIDERRPVVGVVLAPALETLWWGALGHGAARRDASATTAIEARLIPQDQAVAVASRSHRDAETDRWLAEMAISETVAFGSSLKFCAVAEARADYYPRFGTTMEWDTAAGHAVLLAAGGRVLTVDGDPLTYAKPDFRNPGFIAYGRSR